MCVCLPAAGQPPPEGAVTPKRWLMADGRGPECHYSIRACHRCKGVKLLLKTAGSGRPLALYWVQRVWHNSQLTLGQLETPAWAGRGADGSLVDAETCPAAHVSRFVVIGSPGGRSVAHHRGALLSLGALGVRSAAHHPERLARKLQLNRQVAGLATRRRRRPGEESHVPLCLCGLLVNPGRPLRTRPIR